MTTTVRTPATTRQPMLARVYAGPDRIDWSAAYAQPKYDGHRCLATREGLYSRTGARITTCDHILSGLRHLPAGTTIDGELYVHGRPLSQIASLVKRQQAGSKELTLVVYDMIRDEPFAHRMDWLLRFLGAASKIRISPTMPVYGHDELVAAYELMVGRGYEGAMLRHGLEGYQEGKRSGSLLKIKPRHDAEFVVVSVTEATGTHAGEAVFTCRTESGREFSVLSPGSREDKRHFWSIRHALVGRQLTVSFASWTEHGVPFQPVAKCFV